MPIDKEALYPTYNRSVERKQAIHEQAIRKSLDLPADDDVNITTTNNGSSPLMSSLATVGMLATGGTGAIGIAALMGVLGGEPDMPGAQPPPAIVQPVEATFTIQHRNADGDLLNVPQWKPGAQE